MQKAVSIRTNGGTLNVETTDSTISHYGMAASSRNSTPFKVQHLLNLEKFKQYNIK